MVIEGACVTIAMYCLIQFYIQLKNDLSEHQPLLKVAAIKLVIFLSFWQTIIISFLTSTGAIKSSPHITDPDIKVGLPSMLLCIEMAIFSVFHLWAFPWRPYDIKRSAVVAAESAPGYLPDPKTAYKGGPFGVNALMDAFNPWDLVKAVARGFRWYAVGRRTREQDISYKGSVDRGSGFEPSRSHDLSGPWRTDNSFDNQPRPFGSTMKSPGRYQPLSEEEDDQLLAHAQSNPQSHPAPPSTTTNTDDTTYPRPMIRHPTPPPNSRTPAAANDASDLYLSKPDHLPSNPTPAAIRRDQYDGAGQHPAPMLQEEEDTGYHGAEVPPASHEPAPSYLYQSDPPLPHARGGGGAESDVWGGGVQQHTNDGTDRRDYAPGY